MTLYNKLNADFTENFIGNTALAMIISTCIGSIAVMFTLMNGHGMAQMAMVFATVLVCSLHNASILTLQKPKLVFDLLLLSIVTNVALIVGNLLF